MEATRGKPPSDIELGIPLVALKTRCRPKSERHCCTGATHHIQLVQVIYNFQMIVRRMSYKPWAVWTMKTFPLLRIRLSLNNMSRSFDDSYIKRERLPRGDDQLIFTVFRGVRHCYPRGKNGNMSVNFVRQKRCIPSGPALLLH